MSTPNDTPSKIVEADCQSSWERLRAAAVREGTKFSQTEIKPESLLGVYYAVWDSDTLFEIMDHIEDEEFWIELSIKSPKSLENASFADIEGRFQWWRRVGSFKGLIRAKDSKENLWLVNGVTWSASVNVDDDNEEDPWEHDPEALPRAANDFGLACLVTLDSAGNPFLEMLYNTGKPRGPSSLEYVRVFWKKHEGSGFVMLSDDEGRRLMKDGVADLSEARDYEGENEDAEGIEDGEEDAEGVLDEELELQTCANVPNPQTDLKRPAEADDEGPGAKRPKK